MFEVASDHWKRYLSLACPQWTGSDPRHNLGVEVTNRLRQLDVVIRHLDNAIRDVSPDPVQVERTFAWHVANRGRLARGEISPEEVLAATYVPLADPAKYMDDWDLVEIFTEAFYFCAWRMVVVLNSRKSEYRFPGMTTVKARAITIVRNNLIQHPEDKGSQDFTMGLVVLSSGPVLRSLGAVARGDTGRVDPLDDSKDRGLSTAAEELRDELERKFDEAIVKLAA